MDPELSPYLLLTLRVSETFDEVTILFTDIVTFTNISSVVKPIQIVDMLNALYSQYDVLIEEHGVYKVAASWHWGRGMQGRI